MNESLELRADRLDAALKASAEECNNAGLRPLLETAEALKREAAKEVAPLDKNVAKRHKNLLLNMVRNNKQAEQQGQPSKKRRGFKAPLIWFSGAIAVAAVLVAVFIAVKPSGLPQLPGMVEEKISRILIPEAYAMDAFNLTAEASDAAGASVDTAFDLTSKVDVNADDLKQVLRLVPEVQFTVEAAGDNEFKIKPNAALKPNTVYKVMLAAAVQKADGSESARDFSWAVQTKNVFRVLSSVPGDETDGVPLNSAIEVTMSQTGWEDPKDFLSIEPKTDGRFETHGRSLAFIPAKPLTPGQIYTVTYKKGWKIADSDLALQSDYVIRFETLAPELAKDKTLIRLEPSGTFFESAPNREAFINVYGGDIGELNEGIELTGYALSKDDAKKLITEFNAIPWWARCTRERGAVFETYAKNKSFEATSTLESAGNYWQTFFRVPAQKAGIYLVRITPGTATPTTEIKDTWLVLQITDVASYSMSDVDGGLLWVMNVDSKRPLTNMAVKVEDKTYSTDQDGLVRFPTPASISSTSTEPATVILEVGSGELSALAPLYKSGNPWDYGFGWNSAGTDNNVSYLFLDRPLYRNQDHLMFFGFTQDRDEKEPAGEYKIQLRKSGVLDYSSYAEKVYSEQTVTPDDSGFFRGDISWDTLAAGYYELVLLRNGEELRSKNVEIRNIVKPAYSIDVTTDQKSLFAGDVLTGKIKVTHFDGTPVSRFKLTATVSGPYDRLSADIVTDDAGMATYRFETKRQTCDLNQKYVYCSSQWMDYVEVKPAEAEEADILGSTYVLIWSSRVSTQVKPEIKGDTADISFFVRRIDLAKSDYVYSDAALGEPAAGIKITGRLIERHVERIEQGPEFSVFDYIEKKVIPTYRYEMKERVVMNVDLTTDGGGHAHLQAPVANDVTYYLKAVVKDEQGADNIITTGFAKDWYEHYSGAASTVGYNYSFSPSMPRELSNYKLDEEISLSIFNNDSDKDIKVQDSDTPSFLYIETMRGIKKTMVTNKATYVSRFREELIPNVTVYGVMFGARGFTELSTSLSFDPTDRRLSVEIVPDQTSYAPGAKVSVKIKVKKQDGSASAGARMAVSAVDEALLALYGDFDQDPLGILYSWVSDGIIQTRSSHGALSEAFRAGGAEWGGGGGEGVRRNFKDTAAFEVLTADQNGEAVLSFTAPDNITSWRLVASAVTPELYGGYGKTSLAVTKQIFVDAVIPQTLLQQDQPVLKLRAFGTALKAGESLTYKINAPSLGIINQSVPGKAGDPVYLPVDHLSEGTHRILLQVQSAAGTDTIERKVNVLASRFTKDELVTAGLSQGSGLPSLGTLPEASIMFSSLTQTRYLSRVQSLAYPWSARIEAKLAALVSRQLLNTVYNQKDVAESGPLLNYQRDSGGIAILPYASEDVELSAKVAAVAPEVFDSAKLARYLWSVGEDKNVSREEALRAFSGLAALGEPVLIQLARFSEEQDLSWRELLALARGLEAAGDREGSLEILEKLLVKSEDRDGLIRLAVAEDERSVMEATAEAAALAASLHHPKAEGLNAYLEKNWAEDVLSDLDRAYYLKHIIPTLAAGDVTIEYTLDGYNERIIEIKNGLSQYLTLTASEAEAFRAISVSGPAAASFVRRTSGLPATVPEVSLTREYAVENGKIENLSEGMTVMVTLKPVWKENAQDGCYIVRDRLPSGLTPIQSLFFNYYDSYDIWYPTEVEAHEISFVICKTKNPKPIIYKARVVSRGTYLAEPASMQSM
ncbi:Ig-like domain-containing protein, partial [Patescibacteria group bacterium]|nr:Ig-like domain-containing protein [Patescibacteria group bacterium]